MIFVKTLKKRFNMTWFTEKISQIQEYSQIYKEYKTKNIEIHKLMWDEMSKREKIYSEQQSVEGMVVHKIHPECFGDYTHPCVVKRLGWDNDARWLGDALRALDHIKDENFTFPDMVNYCPKFKENTPCEKTECMHYTANQEYYIAKTNLAKALEEHKKFDSLDNLRNETFGKILARLIKKVEERKDLRDTKRAFYDMFVNTK